MQVITSPICVQNFKGETLFLIILQICFKTQNLSFKNENGDVNFSIFNIE